MRLAFALLCVMALLALLGPEISPYTYFETALESKNLAPSLSHWCGTDELGRDLFTRLCFGMRISLFVALLASLLDLILGILYGGFAALLGGKIETLMMRLADVLYAIPYLLITILLAVVIGSGILSITLALALTGWINMARMVRAQFVQLSSYPYVQAAEMLGASRMRLLFIHLLPNSKGPILVQLAVTISSAIFSEAFLSFLGLGVQAPFASLGTMASDALSSLRYYPWRLLFPASTICLLLLSINLLSDRQRS